MVFMVNALVTDILYLDSKMCRGSWCTQSCVKANGLIYVLFSLVGRGEGLSSKPSKV